MRTIFKQSTLPPFFFQNVTKDNFLKILSGDSGAMEGVGSGKVLTRFVEVISSVVENLKFKL